MNILFSNIPCYWKPPEATFVDISPNSVEFQQINAVVKDDSYKLLTLSRQQQHHRYTLFFIREKFLTSVNPMGQYYRVRKYVKVPIQLVDLALETNLDGRRCHYDFVMSSHIDWKMPNKGFLIFIVCVVTWDYHADIIQPTKNSDYFIEYVCQVKKIWRS